MAYSKKQDMDDTLAVGSQERKRYVRGEMTSYNSLTVTTHTYVSRTGNSEMMDPDN